jgi:hypothetical protein
VDIERLPDDWTDRVESARSGLLKVSVDRWQQIARISRNFLNDEAGATTAEREVARLQALESDLDDNADGV